jgi:hypothetical protein
MLCYVMLCQYTSLQLACHCGPGFSCAFLSLALESAVSSRIKMVFGSCYVSDVSVPITTWMLLFPSFIEGHSRNVCLYVCIYKDTCTHLYLFLYLWICIKIINWNKYLQFWVMIGVILVIILLYMLNFLFHLWESWFLSHFLFNLFAHSPLPILYNQTEHMPLSLPLLGILTKPSALLKNKILLFFKQSEFRKTLWW